MAGRTFYVDANGGSDSNNGASPETAWRSIAQVNSQSFQPGDRILFQRGDSFSGTLEPSSSGAAGSPIEFGAYGSGANPVLRGNGRSEVVDVSGVDHIRLSNLDITNGKRGIVLEGTTGSEVIDCNVYENNRDGIYIGGDSADNLVQGGSSHHNGEEDAKFTYKWMNLGHGVLINRGASQNTIDGVELYANAEDGVQFGPSAGDGNVLRDNRMIDNLEDGVDIKRGSHELIGNEMHGNAINAVNVHNDSGTITLTGNDLRTESIAHALDVREGARIISNGNRYEGVNSFAVDLSDGAGNGSSFTNDIFVDGGRNSGASVRVNAGQGHSFVDAVFVMRNDGSALEVGGNADRISVSGSSFYTDGDAMDTSNGVRVQSSGNHFGTASQAANAIAERMAALFDDDGPIPTAPAEPQDVAPTPPQNVAPAQPQDEPSGGNVGNDDGAAGGQPDLAASVNEKLFGGNKVGIDHPSGGGSPAPEPAPAPVQHPADASAFDISHKLGMAGLLHAGDYMFGA